MCCSFDLFAGRVVAVFVHRVSCLQTIAAVSQIQTIADHNNKNNSDGSTRVLWARNVSMMYEWSERVQEEASRGGRASSLLPESVPCGPTGPHVAVAPVNCPYRVYMVQCRRWRPLRRLYLFFICGISPASTKHYTTRTKAQTSEEGPLQTEELRHCIGTGAKPETN